MVVEELLRRFIGIRILNNKRREMYASLDEDEPPRWGRGVLTYVCVALGLYLAYSAAVLSFAPTAVPDDEASLERAAGAGACDKYKGQDACNADGGCKFAQAREQSTGEGRCSE